MLTSLKTISFSKKINICSSGFSLVRRLLSSTIRICIFQNPSVLSRQNMEHGRTLSTKGFIVSTKSEISFECQEVNLIILCE